MKTCLTCQAVTPEAIDGQRLRALISAETVDRSSELLLAAGAELASYRRNPVLLWAHDTTLPPIGRALEVTAEPGVGVWALNEFAPTPFASEIRELYRGGFLHAFSVGFRPLEIDRQRRREGQRGSTILRWELIEQSAVAVPANPDALICAAAEGNRAAAWLLKTYYTPAADAALLSQCGLRSLAAPFPELAAAAVRLHGARGGLALGEPDRQRLEALLRGEYERRRLTWPTAAGGRPLWRHDEPRHFEEREIAAACALVKGRCEALRNIARKRRREGLAMPELDPLAEAQAYLAEVLESAPGGPSAGAGALEAVVAEVRGELASLSAGHGELSDALLTELRRASIGGARRP